MGSYNFTLNAAQQIVAAVKKVQANPTDLTGQPNPSMRPGESMWAMLVTPGDESGKFWSWTKVVPDSVNVGAAGISTTAALTSAWKIADPTVVGIANARESNDTLGIPAGTVVRLTFVGYSVPNGSGYEGAPGTSIDAATATDLTGADGTVPYYVFSYNLQTFENVVPIHDHRDSFNGGFAFAVFHPGTAIPQMPWSV